MSTVKHPPTHDCPADVLGWIPWYPDGLEESQRGAVEAHAAACAECRAELEMLLGNGEAEDAPEPERVYAQVLARMEAMRPAADASRDPEERPLASVSRLPARAEREAAREETETPPEPTGWRRISRVQSQRGLAIAAGLLMALALGSWMASPNESTHFEEPVYETASARPDESPTATTSASLEVVFREGASAAEITAALRALGARVTSGPSQLGVYRLELGAETDVDAARRLLTEDRGAVATFAEKPLHP